MLSERESEILGLMFGDGCLSRTENSVQISITGNKTDDERYLLDHVRPLFDDVLGLQLTCRYRKGENTMDLYRHSKRTAHILHSWGMPFGLKKVAELRPKLDVASAPFVKGVFDTDGCVYRKYGPYAQIQFKSASESLVCFVREQLVQLGLHPTLVRPDETKHRFLLCRQAEVDSFFRIISPSNPKHLTRLSRIRAPNVHSGLELAESTNLYSKNSPDIFQANRKEPMA